RSSGSSRIGGLPEQSAARNPVLVWLALSQAKATESCGSGTRLERRFVLLENGQVWTAVPACGQIVMSLPRRQASRSNEIGGGRRRTAIDAGTAVKIDASPGRSQCR